MSLPSANGSDSKNKDESGSPFRLTMSGWTRDKIRKLYHRSVALGVRLEFVQSMLEIENALRTTLKTWGDPIANLAGLRMTRYQRLYDNLILHYSVHVEQPVVWLVHIEPTQRSPLRIGEG